MHKGPFHKILGISGISDHTRTVRPYIKIDLVAIIMNLWISKIFLCCLLSVILQYLHEQKVIHHDIKPENFKLDKEHEHLKITDYRCTVQQKNDVASTTQRGTWSAARIKTIRVCCSFSRFLVSKTPWIIENDIWISYLLMYSIKRFPKGWEETVSHTFFTFKTNFNCHILS